MELKPHEYQDRATQWGIANPRGYYAIDMGMGKTLIILELLACLKKMKAIQGTLVIAPLGTIYTTWPDEIKKWNSKLTYSILHGPDRVRNLKRKRDVYFINFEGVEWMYNELVKMARKKKAVSPFNCLVIDEASMVKSSKTKRFKMLSGLRSLFPERRYFLSGTPAPNGYMDLWSQYYLLNDGASLGMGIGNYRKKYFEQDPFAMFTYNLKDGSEELILNRIKKYTFRLDSKDYLKLPNSIYNEIKLDLSSKNKALYKKLEKEFFLALDDVEVEAFNAASLSMKLRQFLQGSMYYTKPEDAHLDKPPRYVQKIHTEKIKALADIVDTSGSKPILLALNFKFEKDMIEKYFPDAKFIVGGMKRDTVNRYIKEWNLGKIQLLCCHPASIGHGTNLQTGGHIIVWYGLTWSLELYQQFNKRLDRQGQTESVIFHHLLVKGTVDIRIARIIKQKGMTQKKMLDYLKEDYHART